MEESIEVRESRFEKEYAIKGKCWCSIVITKEDPLWVKVIDWTDLNVVGGFMGDEKAVQKHIMEAKKYNRLDKQVLREHGFKYDSELECWYKIFFDGGWEEVEREVRELIRVLEV